MWLWRLAFSLQIPLGFVSLLFILLVYIYIYVYVIPFSNYVEYVAGELAQIHVFTTNLRFCVRG